MLNDIINDKYILCLVKSNLHEFLHDIFGIYI